MNPESIVPTSPVQLAHHIRVVAASAPVGLCKALINAAASETHCGSNKPYPAASTDCTDVNGSVTIFISTLF